MVNKKIMKFWKQLSENQNWTLSLAIGSLIIAFGALIISIFSFSHQVNVDSITLELEEQGRKYEEIANNLNSALVNNSDIELEILKKKTSFEISQLLYEEFYKFGSYNTEVIKKLENAAKERISTGAVSSKNLIQNQENLQLYLNTFESVYEQCKSGMITFEDVRVNFEYLIGDTCNNQQVKDALNGAGNGLKLLCSKFHPNSELSKLADSSKDSCN